MNDRIKWQPLSKHGIEENGKEIFFPVNLGKKNDKNCSIYRQYHGEIIKRATPTLKAIAKKRKKKEQEDLANAAKLTKIQEDSPMETNSVPPPPSSSSRRSSLLPEVLTKQPNPVQDSSSVSAY